MTNTSHAPPARVNRFALVAGVVLILAGFTGCAPDVQKPSDPVASPEAQAPATEEPAEQPLVIPGCADLPVAAGLTAGRGAAWEPVEQVGPENYHVYSGALGPQALAALETSPQSEYCVWVRSATFGEVWVETLAAELEPATQAELIAGLRGSEYLESVSDEVLMFSYELATNTSPLEIRYAFFENIWVISISSVADGLPDLARDLMLEGVRSQNSAIGE